MKNMNGRVIVAAVVLLASGGLSALLSAQPSESPREPASESPVNSRTAAADALNDESLKLMLVGLGYDPKKLTKGYLLAIKRDTWTLNVQVVISKNRTKVGINANLGVVPEPDNVTAAQWRDLLVRNGDIDPSSFYFDKDVKKLYLHRSFDNRGLTPDDLKFEIGQFTSQIRETEALWRFTK